MNTTAFIAANDNAIDAAILRKLDTSGIHAEIDFAFPEDHTPAKRALLMAQAKHHYEDMFPETKKGNAQALAARRAHGKVSGQSSAPAFVTVVVGRAGGRRGWSESSVKQVVRRGERIAINVLEAVIADELFDTGVHLDELATFNHADQMPLYRYWKSGDSPPPAAAKVEPEATGAVWRRQGHVLECADSLARMDRMAKRGDRFDCILVDPPYGIDYRGGRAGVITGDEDPQKAAELFVPRMAALVKPGRALCIWASAKTAFVWVTALTRAGLAVHEVIEWDKVEAWFDGRAKEVLIVASIGALEVVSDDGATTWSYPTTRDEERRTKHSSPKPPELMHFPVLKYTRPAETVFDPCAGLAPVGEACIALGRRYHGIELMERHFKDAESYLVGALAPDTTAKAA